MEEKNVSMELKNDRLLRKGKWIFNEKYDWKVERNDWKGYR